MEVAQTTAKEKAMFRRLVAVVPRLLSDSSRVVPAAALAFGVLAMLGAILLPAPAEADSGWQVRLRMINLSPDEDSTVIPIGGSVDATSDTVPELDISYFFTDNIAAELILATTRHSLTDDGSTLGNVDLGKVSLLPPTLSLQWHFLPDETFRPYAGLSLNYTFFFDESAPRTTVTDIDYDNRFGYGAQIGADYGLTEHWFLNVDLKKLFLNTDVTINGGAITGDVDLDPWIFGAGFGYRF